MKSNFRKLTVVLIGLIVIYEMSGCATSSDPTSVNPTNTEMSTAKITLPAFTPTTLPANNQLTPKPTQTRIPIPTEIPTRTALPTVTAISTLQAKAASAEILRLLSSPNDTCTFPCWWGLIPGQTRIVDAQNYLNSFRALSGASSFDAQGGHTYLYLPQSNNSYLAIHLEFKGNYVFDWLQVSIYRNINVTHPTGEATYEISWNDPKLAEITKPYSLSQVLSTYGQPAEVLVFTYQVAMLNRPHPLSLVVFYPERGFMIEYVTDITYEGAAPNLNLKNCPSLAYPYFGFWTPTEEITLKDVASWIPGYQLNKDWLNSGKFKTLEEATGMSIEEFYALYTNDESACITTPAEIWPMPGE